MGLVANVEDWLQAHARNLVEHNRLYHRDSHEIAVSYGVFAGDRCDSANLAAYNAFPFFYRCLKPCLVAR